MLLKHPDVECVGVTDDGAAVAGDILSATPDTVLMEEAGGRLSREAITLLEDTDFKGRLVSVSLTANRLRVYRREERVAVKAEDLLRLILS
jgi:hypothetical protein